jgi:hypothetical protein
LSTRRLIIVVLLAALAHTCAAGQTRSRRRAPARAPERVVGIEAIDFENYSYALAGKTYKLIGGYYANAAAPDAQWELRVAEPTYYADLTGDGRNEAVVVLSYGAVGGPHTVEARVYTLRDGRASQNMRFVLATEVSCELDHYIDLDEGKVRVESIYGSGGRCEHNLIREFRWDGNSFEPVGEAKTMPCRCM